MGKILHISDLHFGSPYRPNVGEAVLRLEAALAPDVTICSGDIVQWGESKQSWNQAREFFDRLQHPYRTIPGNHDLPRIQFWRRLSDLFTNYRDALGTAENFEFEREGLCVVGLASGTFWSVDLGFLSLTQLKWMKSVFQKCPEGSLRVLVQHQAPKSLNRGILRTHSWGASRALQWYQDAGVDLILTGHNHFPHIETLPKPNGTPLIWAQSGTTASCRVRNAASHFNACNVVHFSKDAIEVVVYSFDPSTEEFIPFSQSEFQR